jgi:hypothetical protein
VNEDRSDPERKTLREALASHIKRLEVDELRLRSEADRQIAQADVKHDEQVRLSLMLKESV